MEKKHPKMEKSDRIIWRLEELSGHARPYTCSFCKKGFSNAQALGGHMNIHRKDRAKLRESSQEQENMLSLDIVKTTSLPDHDHIGLDAIENVKQLQLFVEGSSMSDDVQTSGDNEEGSLLLIHGSSSRVELDLELRLGPEPLR
ncbi:hypothetical protein DITRI_Ditri12bG0170900 [Diplodiscus trichospermus]